jgi:hypothetical protein
MTTDAIILGPSVAARVELQFEFAQSSIAWTLRAIDATRKGDMATAAACSRIAEIADAVSRGVSS